MARESRLIAFQLKAIVAHDPTTTLRLKSIYLFSHPSVELEWALYSKDAAPDFFRAFAHLRILQRNHFIVQTLIGILDAYVRSFLRVRQFH